MTKEELMTLLRNPDQTGQAIDELNRLIDEYPYFHTAHQLYLKGLRQADETKMAFQLKKAALCVRDRDVLYHYINSPSPRQASIPDSPTTPSQPPLPLQKDEEEQNTDDHVIAEGNIISNDQLMNIIGYRPEQIKPYQPEEIPPQPEEKKQPSFEAATDTVEATEQFVDPTPIEIREVYSEKQLVADLIKIRQVKPDSAEAPPQNIPEKEETTENTVAADDNRRWTSGELIDFFLKSNPKIVPNDSRYEADLSEGLQDNREVATETLADIYATQGHKDKAIEIYEQLILKYPEKHIYFAAQIERLKE